MQYMRRSITFLFILLIISSQGLSQDLVTDRPDQTESSVTVPFGSLQIETGMLFGSFGESLFKTKSTLLPTTLLRYGITKGLELRFVNQFERIKAGDVTHYGMNDLELGVKFQILKNQNINTEIAFLSHVIIPTGSKKLTNNKYGSINKLAISHTINDKMGIGYNVGYNYFGEGKGDFTYSLALGISVSDRIGIFFEPYGEVVEFKDFQANFDTGITYLLSGNFQLDFSLGTGINHKMSYLSLGLSWRILKKS
jgi:hypothetical protein